MALHSGARASALASLLLVGACMSGESTGSKTDPGTGADNGGSDNGNGSGTGITNSFSVTTLAADQPGMGATNIGPNLINAWGLVAFQGMFWIANEGTGKVSILDGAGKPSTKPASDSLDLGEGITGIAVNDSTAMQINGKGTTCGPANLIFASVHGQLIGVNTDIDPTGGQVLVDRADVMASYTGVATIHGPRMGMGTGTGTGTPDMAKGPVLVLAADFHNARIDVFDENFKLLATPMFTVPDLPAGFAPFNVWGWNDTVYVTFAKQDEAKVEEVTGPGLGFVAAFDVSGKLMWTAKGIELDAPWGMSLVTSAMVSTTTLVVGNFGDGHLTAIDPATGAIVGQLMDDARAPIAIDGLWGIALGTGVQNARPDGLYFAAGPDDEAHGMFGVVTLAAPPTM